MDEIVYKSLSSYYHVLETKGYMAYQHLEKLLILVFYWEFIFSDFRGLLSKEDYSLIERALDCLYGSTCLIPYPMYVKTGKLNLGQVTEFAYRLKKLEDTEVLKLSDLETPDDSDIEISVEGTQESEQP